MRTLVLALVLVAALGGCTSRSYQASPSNFSREAECARNGGRWHQAIDPYAFCEIRS
jgi:hypothetical protein